MKDKTKKKTNKNVLHKVNEGQNQEENKQIILHTSK